MFKKFKTTENQEIYHIITYKNIHYNSEHKSRKITSFLFYFHNYIQIFLILFNIKLKTRNQNVFRLRVKTKII